MAIFHSYLYVELLYMFIHFPDLDSTCWTTWPNASISFSSSWLRPWSEVAVWARCAPFRPRREELMQMSGGKNTILLYFLIFLKGYWEGRSCFHLWNCFSFTSWWFQACDWNNSLEQEQDPNWRWHIFAGWFNQHLASTNSSRGYENPLICSRVLESDMYCANCPNIQVLG